MFQFTLGSLFISFFCFSALAQEDNSKNTVIINNEVQESSKNEVQITAPALVPSSAGKLRTLREKQEVQTEDALLKELEKKRLLDEQKRLDSLMGQGSGPEAPAESSVTAQPAPVASSPMFPYSYGSLGVGYFLYPNVENVNTQSIPAGFLSFGAYQKPFLIDASIFYSTTILTPKEQAHKDKRRRIYEPGLSATIKYSLFNRSATKPYLGISGAFIGRKQQWINKDGTVPKASKEVEKLNKDVGLKEWKFSCYIGGAGGLDIALGKQLGLNIDLKYYVNLCTENRRAITDPLNAVILDKRDLIMMSINAKYLF